MAVLGFADVPARGTVYRVFSLQTRSQVIQVAQDMRVRRTLARDAAWQSLLPIALLAPVLALAVWWVVRSSLAPVQRVRRELATRRPQDLAPVPAEGLPDEVRPLVAELNALLQRVGQAFEAQQHFVADAAHELRSPLAALKLQLVALQRAPDVAAHDEAVQRLSAGIDRATRLVEQLLTLARQEAQGTVQGTAPGLQGMQGQHGAAAAAPADVDLREVVEQALADQAVAAQQHGLGLVFLLMVMYAPGGVASLIMMNLRVARFGKWRRLAQPYLAIAASALVMIVGGAAIVEMIYHLQLNAALGPQVSFMGVQLDTSSASTWTVAVAIFVVGLGLLEVARRWCLRRWERIQEEIEEAIKIGRASCRERV